MTLQLDNGLAKVQRIFGDQQSEATVLRKVVFETDVANKDVVDTKLYLIQLSSNRFRCSLCIQNALEK